MAHAVVFRTAERNEYLKRSFPAFLERTSEHAKIAVIINTDRERLLKEAKDIVDTVVSSRISSHQVEIKQFKKRLGNPGSINRGVEFVKSLWPKTSFVLIADDDVLVPEPVKHEGGKLYWDVALVKMLQAGWEFAWHAEHRSFHNEDETSKLKQIGGVWGYKRNFVGGACTAFRVSDWDRVGGVNENSHLFGYQGFQKSVARQGLIGLWTKPSMVSTHFDLPSHPWSLRRTKYRGWFHYMRKKQSEDWDDYEVQGHGDKPPA